ncbi:pyruvate dehydrogenase complex dihydrolipoamide acetyltransferase [Aquamicrobium segne]|uniref:Acetyltransferase component of pyruvate dehydrogenase complex n=1 Tax=Aquamicrobium segne TaxID=469547 RepID=A0ABW0H1E6_9HYPH
MAEILRLPAILANMTEGTLARWLKAEGDMLVAGEAFAEVETDKAVVEISSENSGRLARILHEAGKVLPVDTAIGVLALAGDDDAAIAAAVMSQTEAEEAEALTFDAEVQVAPSVSLPESRVAASPNRLFASPLARRLARENSIDLARLTGSGPKGRIMRDDVKAHLDMAASAAPVAPATAPPFVTDAPHDSIPHSQMRRTIARRLTESKQNIPHFYLSADCQMDALIALRQKINADRPGDARISVNDLVVKAAAAALAALPTCNVSWTEDALLQWHRVDISVAVATDGGLITPIITQADRKSLSAISAEIGDLASRARAGTLRPDEYQGGSFTISNLGMYGVRDFAAILNPPQAAILAVGAIEPRMIVRDRQSAIADMMTCTLSLDHRAIDGALGAQWLGLFKELIENPLRILT